MVRTLPTGSMETFTLTIQPMLLNYCTRAATGRNRPMRCGWNGSRLAKAGAGIRRSATCRPRLR